MNKPTFSIGRKFLIAFLAIVILASGAVTTVALFTSRKVLEEEARERLDTIADLKISQLRLWVEREKNILQGLAGGNVDFYHHLINFSTNRHSVSDEGLHEHVDQFMLLNPAFMEFLILDPVTGEQIFSSDLMRDSPLHQAYVHLDSAFLEKAKTDTLTTGIFYSDVLKASAIMITTPIRDDQGHVRLIIAAHLNSLAMSDFLSDRFGFGETGLAYIVSPLGHVVAGSKHEFLLNESVSSYGIAQGIAGAVGTSFYQNFKGNDVIGYYHWMEDFNAVFMAEQDVSEALAPLRELERQLIFFIALVLLLSVLVSFVFSRLISLPILRLTRVAQDISSGKFHLRADVKSNDEIGMLADAFNEMSSRLVASFAESKNIIQTMPEALFTLAQDGTIRFLNRQAQQLSGCKTAKLVGKPFVSLLVHNQETFGLFERLRKERRISDFQTVFYDCKHHKIPVSLSMMFEESKKGNVFNILVIVRDLRELRHYAKQRLQTIIPFLQRISVGDFSAELPLVEASDEFSDLFAGVGLMTDNLRQLIKENEDKTHQVLETHQNLLEAKTSLETEKVRLNSILENMGDGLIAIDTEGRLLMMNKMAEVFFGRERTDLLGKNYFDEIALEDKESQPLLRNHRPLVQAMEHHHHVLKVIYVNGKPYRSLASPLVLNRKLFGAVEILQDVSREQAVDKAKSEFVSLASHQLRTPLTSIRWLLEELLRKKSDSAKDSEEYLNNALESTQRMIRLVNDLLNLSRMEAGAIDVEPQDTNLGDLVGQVVSDARAAIHQHRQTVLVHKPKGGIPLHADPILIRQVVTNLLSNALRYSDPDKTITITLEKKDRKAWFIIQDQGIGIPKDQQSRLYEKFFRTEEASKRVTSGSGLGMYLVKKITEALHAEITFVSAPGKGTTFRVGFPLKSALVHKGPQKLIEYHIS